MRRYVPSSDCPQIRDILARTRDNMKFLPLLGAAYAGSKASKPGPSSLNHDNIQIIYDNGKEVCRGPYHDPDVVRKEADAFSACLTVWNDWVQGSMPCESHSSKSAVPNRPKSDFRITCQVGCSKCRRIREANLEWLFNCNDGLRPFLFHDKDTQSMRADCRRDEAKNMLNYYAEREKNKAPFVDLYAQQLHDQVSRFVQSEMWVQSYID